MQSNRKCQGTKLGEQKSAEEQSHLQKKSQQGNKSPGVQVSGNECPETNVQEQIHLQGPPWQTGFFELALRDRNVQVGFF